MTGQWLGMIGGDYWHFGATGAPDTSYPLNPYAISYWQSGGLLTMTEGMPNPTTGGGADDTSRVDATGIVTAGNATNTAFNKNLDYIAAGKPVALAEFGSGGPSAGDPSFSMSNLISQIQQDMPDTVFWQQWWAGNSGGPGWGMELDANLSQALNNSYVINRGSIACTTGSCAP
jgi:hypothetical protein